MNVLGIEDPFNVSSSNPSLLAIKLNLLQLFCKVIRHFFRPVGTQAPPVTNITVIGWAVSGKESSKKRCPGLSSLWLVPSSNPLVRPHECHFASLARAEAEVSPFSCRVQEVTPA